MTVEAIHRFYRRVFPRKPRPPLAQARRHADEITRLLYRYWRAREYEPSEADIRGLRDLEQRLFRLHGTGRRLIMRLERRFRGELEVNEGKWLEWPKRTRGH
jgi:hypothetical protein